MKNEKYGLPLPTIRRLQLYLSFLKLSKKNDKQFVSAPEIAKELHIHSTQITKDFSYINVTGKTKVGYKTDVLITVIENLFGYHNQNKAYIVGIGNLGIALIEYNTFNKEGLEIIAGFDIDTKKAGIKINNTKIFNVNKFKQNIEETPVTIGIITVPANSAQKVADLMIKCGIKAIWNFTGTTISAPNNVIVENTSIDSGLAMVKWKLYENKMV